MDHSDTSSEMEAPFEDDYRHRRLSMHRTANIRSLRAGATSPDDREHTSYSNMEETANDHVNQIVDKIVEEEACLLGESAMTGMEYRQDALKNMPQSLTMKKMVKERLHLRMTQSKRVSGWKQMKYNMSLSSRKCRSKFQDFLMIFELWNGTMKKSKANLALLQQFIFVSFGLFGDFHSLYGYYQNITIHVANNFSYSMPLAYFYTMICVYGLLLLVLAISMMRSYRVNFIETKGGLKNIFAHKVFCTWDFSIATENASRLKSSAIYHEFKELLEEELRSHEQLSCKSKFFTFMLRLAGHLLVLVVVGASGYGIWLCSSCTGWQITATGAVYLRRSPVRSFKMERPEFEIAKHTVHLIYNQALFWLGLLFTPVLGAMIVIKFLIMWYFTTVVEIKFSKPSTKFWRATNTHTWFLVITFVTALLIMAVLGCIMALYGICVELWAVWKFVGRKEVYLRFLKDEILKMEQGVMVLQILAYLLKPGVVAVVITVMMGFIYYLRARALAQQKMVSVLREMIVIESKDKDFLLQRIRMLAKEWKFTSCATTDPMMTPTEKLYKQQENQTEFHRNQETVVPQRADDWTSMSSGQIPSVSYRNKSKRH
ncbi:transmembrane channel-like protein 7 [Atheta coriaria]|uniref:transmembrane channel-like protein 7 n=1 Tax=Dalotia coriaria TaxID=877792 RepID=UPI0031F44176